MQGNDLGNQVTPRDALVWEGLLGLLPDVRIVGMEAKYRKKRKWREAVSCYQVNELLARKIWQVTWDTSLRVDLITHLGHDFAEALQERMEQESMPFQHVWHEDPNVLGRSLVLQPDIRTIYTGITDHQFTYGGKGRVLDPTTAHLYFGAM